jgi:hypothetical protein
MIVRPTAHVATPNALKHFLSDSNIEWQGWFPFCQEDVNTGKVVCALSIAG